MQANADDAMAASFGTETGVAGMNTDELKVKQEALAKEKRELESTISDLEGQSEVLELENAALQDPQFGKLSQYQSTANGKSTEINNWSGLLQESGFSDVYYDYINKNPKAVQIVDAQDSAQLLTFAGMGKEYLQNMTDQEVKVYNY